MSPTYRPFAFYLIFIFLFHECRFTSGTKCLMTECPNGYEGVFKPDHTYVFTYSVDIVTKKDNFGQQSDEDTVSFYCDVEVIADKFCNLFLSLSSPRFADKHNNSFDGNLIAALTDQFIIFHYEQGKVVECCTSQMDSDLVINLKLGILSILQYTSTNSRNYNVTEVNINGECKSHYSKSEVDEWTVLRRTINLNDCLLRTVHQKKFFNLFDNINVIKSDQLIQSQQKCRHVIGRSGEPVLALCTENHIMKPIKDSTTLIVSIRQRLDLDRIVIKTVSESSFDNFTSNKYQYVYSFENEVERDVLRQRLHTFIKNKKGINGSNDFREILEDLEYNDIMSVLNQYQVQDRRLFFSAVENVLSDKLWRLILDFYDKDEISEEQMRHYLYMIPYVKDPTINMIKTIKNFLSNRVYVPLAYYSLSGLIRNFCGKNNTCDEHEEIVMIFEKMEIDMVSMLDLKKFDEILIRLIFIRNAGISTSMNGIESIYRNKMLPKKLRLAAIRTYTHVSCDYFPKDSLFQVFANKEEDSIVRLQSFLTIMNCPSRELYVKIFTVFLEENVNRVTQFAWNYLEREPWFNDLLDDGKSLDWEQLESDSSEISNGMNSLIRNLNESLQIIIIDNKKNNEPDLFKVSSFIEIFGSNVNIYDLDTYTERFKLELNDDTDNEIYDVEDVTLSLNKESDDFMNRYFYISIVGNTMHFSNTDDEKNTTLKSKMEDSRFHHSIAVLEASFLSATCTGFPLSVQVKAEVAVDASLDIDRSAWDKTRLGSYFETLAVVNTTMALNSLFKLVQVQHQYTVTN